jgi:hypothetical protein
MLQALKSRDHHLSASAGQERHGDRCEQDAGDPFEEHLQPRGRAALDLTG